MAGDQPSSKRTHEAEDAAEVGSSKRLCFDYDDLVVILVGGKAQRFTIHRAALCAKSKFFQAESSNRWQNGQEKLVRLPKVCPRTFQRYASWAYTGDFDISVVPADALHDLVMLHLLGDGVDDVELRKRTMQRLCEQFHRHNIHPYRHTIKLAFTRTKPQSLLRKFMVDITVFRQCREDFADSYLEGLPADVVKHIALKALQQIDIIDQDAFFEKKSEYLE